MKAFKLIFTSVVFLTLALWLPGCSGYIIATGPPSPPVEIMIAPPSVYHVWVPGYYSYRGGNYVWIKGSYQVPPRGRTYVPGQWQKTNRGYKHNHGHWKKG
jgi:hypothetical protein